MSLQFDKKWRHHLLPVGSKTHKRVNLGSCSGRDFLIIQKISKRFKVLERVIQVLHFLFCNPFDINAHWPRNVVKMDLPLSAHDLNGYFRIIVAFMSHIRVHERFQNKWKQALFTAVVLGLVSSRFALPHQLAGILVKCIQTSNDSFYSHVFFKRNA